MNLYQQNGLSNLIGLKLEVGADWLKIRSGSGISIYSAWQGLTYITLSCMNEFLNWSKMVPSIILKICLASQCD